MSLPRRRHVVSESDDDEDQVLLSHIKKNRASVVNPVTVGNGDDEAPSSFKGSSTYMRYAPSVVNPVVVVGNEEYEAPRSFKKATTYVKNRTWGANSVTFDNDDDEAPLHSSMRASTSVKNRPTLSQQKSEDLIRRRDQWCSKYIIEDSEGDEKTQQIEDHAKSGSVNAGRPNKKHKGTTSTPAIEDTMFIGQKASQQGQQYSISRCLEVLHGMDDVSDETKVLASDVFKDEASREFFLFYESRLRGLWLKKEVAKLGAQLPPCK